MRAIGAALLGLAALAWTPALAESGGAPMKPAEVCLIYPGPQDALADRVGLFEMGLREQRLVIGRDVAVSGYAGSGDAGALARAAAGCVARDVRAIAAVASAVAAAHAATRIIAIVALDLETDPVAVGVVESLAHPGGNVTGVYFDFPDFIAKQLELLNEATPGLRRIAVLWDPATNDIQLRAVRALAKTRGLVLIEQEITEIAALGPRFQAFVEGRAQALLILSSPQVVLHRASLAALALAHRLPAITMFPEFAQAGGLMGYGPTTLVLYGTIGETTGKILRGAKPADLPIDRPARLSLVVNLATAKKLDVTIAPALLGRADEVVE